MSANQSKKVIYAALVGNSMIAVSKFFAASVTGSSAMLSEGIHSVVDSGNQLLLLWGIRVSNKGPDEKHPFGYGMELYFWTFVVAILIFAIGSGISLYEGFKHLGHPEPLTAPAWNYGVLIFGMVFEGWALSVAYKEFNKMRGDQPLIKAIRHSKDPTVFTVLFEDSAAMLGLIIAFVGVAGSHVFGWHFLDAWASIGIGIVLAVVAIALAIESKGLLIGEGADPETVKSIRACIEEDKDIKAVNELLTMHLSPQDILVNASIDFVDGISAEAVEAAISNFEKQIKAKHPDVKRIFIEAQSISGHIADLEANKTGESA
ncbi:cation diffusion facilitator family transporter [Pseudophaeobacter leonis]|uniref:cation diffusion facilitator family transporter n=1 Tax=Pseudophaeobacter leonis TaxID=1144477 RepID=UPI0009F29755|nr:cation diffusion facilitator family transporter [Pseudophaeobacter leonis]